MNASIERTQKFYKKLGKAMIVVAVAFVALLLGAFSYFQSQSPAYLFINDTESDVHAYLIGGTSPGVRIDLAPGEEKLVDMPFWWGKPDLPRAADGERVQPEKDFIIYKVYKLSTFPEEWLN